MTPRVSVVIPAFRNAAYIDRTMDSVLGQTFEDFEVVVADHSSDDATQEILERYAGEPRVRLLDPTPAGGGAAANWNRVTEEARGELLKLVCGDDLIARRCLELQVRAFDADPSLVMVAARRDLVDDRGRMLRRGHTVVPSLRGTVSAAEAIRATVRVGTNIFGEPAAVLMRRKALAAAGGWDGRNGYYIDAQTYVQVIAGGEVRFLEDSLAAFRISASQWSVRLANQQASQARRFHRFARDQWPGLVSSGDVLRGDARAAAGAYLRRGIYLALDLRRSREDRKERSGRPIVP